MKPYYRTKEYSVSVTNTNINKNVDTNEQNEEQSQQSQHHHHLIGQISLGSLVSLPLRYVEVDRGNIFLSCSEWKWLDFVTPLERYNRSQKTVM